MPEGFSGMLYIAEAPLHFGLMLSTAIILLLMTLVGLLWVVRTENAGAGLWSGFLSIFFAFFMFLILTIVIYQLPAAATLDQLLPYALGAWTCVAFHAFFLLFYLLGFKWLRARVWVAFLPIIGTISFIAILWLFATPANTFVVSDGVMNWLAMPLIVVGYGGFLAIFYMLLVPLIVTYRVTKDQTGNLRMGNWIGWIGLLLWFIAAIMMALVQYLAPYMLLILGLMTIAWAIVFIGWLLSTRGITQQK